MAFDDAVEVTPIYLKNRTAVDISTLEAGDDTNGHRFPVNRHTLLRVVNGGASPITVTINISRKYDGVDLSNITFTVDDGDDVIWTGFTETMTQGDTGEAYITLSADDSVELQVIQP